jgi:hypothetical protein
VTGEKYMLYAQVLCGQCLLLQCGQAMRELQSLKNKLAKEKEVEGE